MSERYVKLFNTPENLYTEGSPVIISAGALLKDTLSGKVLVQLKIKNITDKVIKAAKISVTSFDTAGNPLEGTTEHEYLDLCVYRDEEFAQKVPVILPDDTTRSFSVTATEVVFTDGSVWKESGGNWASLKTARSLFSWLGDLELAKQFQIEFGDKCEFEPTEDRDLRICSCGRINNESTKYCAKCGCAFADLKAADLSKLEKDAQARVEEERTIAAEREALMMKRIKIGAIAGGIILVVWIIVSSIVSSYEAKLDKYNKALGQTASDPDAAIELFTELGGFKDSEEKIEEIYEERYENAKRHLDSKSYDVAIRIFTWLGDYKDSKKLLSKAEKLQDEAKTFKDIIGLDTKYYRDNRESYKKLTASELTSLLPREWYYIRTGASYTVTLASDGTGVGNTYSKSDIKFTWAVNADGTLTLYAGNYNQYATYYKYDVREVTDGAYALYVSSLDEYYSDKETYDPAASGLLIKPESDIGKKYK